MREKEELIRDSLLAWFETNRRLLPWRRNRSAYTTWVSETMLQQTRVAAVIPYFRRFLALFPDIPTLARAPQEEVYKAWEGLGYYSRAANLKKGAQYCVDHFDGHLPSVHEELLRVPGIGPYSAGAIASLAFGLPEPAVDGNVIRVFSRLYGLLITAQDIAARKEVSAIVRSILPQDRAGDFNEAVMDLGATVCTPGNPSCDVCPLSALCEANMLGRQADFPLRRKKKPIPVIPYTIVVLEKDGKVFIRQRPDTGLLASLFEFPSYDGFLSEEELREHLQHDFGILPGKIISITSLGGASHVFSHLKWDMEGYLVMLQESRNESALPLPLAEGPHKGAYYAVSEAQKQAFASALKAYTSAVFHNRNSR